jgi:hypothetical protein
MFFLCRVEDTSAPEAHDDVAETFFIPIEKIEPQKFGLGSVRRGVERFIEMKRQKTALFAKKETSPGISE